MTYIILITSFLSIALVFWFYQKMSVDHFYRMSCKAILRTQYRLAAGRYFCSYAILETVKFLKEKNKKDALVNLMAGRIDKAGKELERAKKYALRASLYAHYNANMPMDDLPFVERAELFFLCNDYKNMEKMLERIEKKKMVGYARAKMLYLLSYANLQDGDLLTAESDANRALKIFKREQAHREAAKIYVLLGMLYRGSAVFDTAQFMFEVAREMSKKLGDKGGEVEATANIGMLMSAQERFEEAEILFNRAMELDPNYKDEVYILNQKGLLFLLQKKYTKALSMLKKAKKLSEKNGLKEGLAFSCQLMAYVKFEQKKLEEAEEYAKAAADAYEAIGDVSARLESEFLCAQCEMALENLEKSEEIARKLIDAALEGQTNFHVANAYNLLGTIYIQKGDLKRAKSLFQESLRHEHKNERNEGIASDYYNIGLIEEKIGEKHEALRSMEAALEYASMFGETEMSRKIRKKLKECKSPKKMTQ